MDKNKKSSFFAVIREKRVTTVAGAWVYFFLSSLIPLLFLLVTAFGVFGVKIGSDLVSRLPEGLREGGTLLLNTANNAQQGVTVLFVFTVLFSSSALLAQMRKDGNCIYGVYSKSRRGVMNRAWAFMALTVLFAVFLFVALVVAFGEKLFVLLPSGRGKRVLIALSVGVVFTALSYGVIILLNKYICPVKISKSTICLASLLSLGIIFLGTLGLGLYLNFFGLNNAFYGSLAGIVVFLLWSYITMTGLVVGTVFGYYLQNYQKT